MLLTHALALSANQLYARKSLHEHVHAVTIGPTKLILVGHEDNLPSYRSWFELGRYVVFGMYKEWLLPISIYSPINSPSAFGSTISWALLSQKSTPPVVLRRCFCVAAAKMAFAQHSIREEGGQHKNVVRKYNTTYIRTCLYVLQYRYSCTVFRNANVFQN